MYTQFMTVAACWCTAGSGWRYNGLNDSVSTLLLVPVLGFYKAMSNITPFILPSIAQGNNISPPTDYLPPLSLLSTDFIGLFTDNAN